jgi:hypothetical protein
MSKTNHTPAPWAVDGTTAAENLDVIGENGRVAMLDCDDIDADTLEANARLIAAAPELLEALILLLNVESAALWGARLTAANNGLDVAYHFDKARAAIAKASGEAA